MRLSNTSQFLAIWSGEFASLIGSSLSSFGIATWVFTETHDAKSMAGLLFWKFATQIYLSMFAGHIVDRWPKRQTLFLANLGFLIVSAALAFQFWHGTPSMLTLYAAMALFGAFDSLKNLSFQALTPLLIDRDSLSRFNGLVTVFENLPPVIGPPLAAVLLKFVGIQVLVIADTLSFAFALIPLLLIRPEESRIDRPPTNLRAVLSPGLQHIWKDPELLRIQMFFTFQNFFNGVVAGLVGAYILTRTGGDQSALATVTSMIALAAVVGGIWQSAFPVKERLVLAIVALTALGALTGRIAVGFGFGALAWGLGLGLRSFFNPIVSACNQTYWQQRVAREIQGRVFGARRVLGQGLYPLAIGAGAIMSTWFVDAVGTPAGTGLANLFILMGAIEFFYAAGWFAFAAKR